MTGHRLVGYYGIDILLYCYTSDKTYLQQYAKIRAYLQGYLAQFILANWPSNCKSISVQLLGKDVAKRHTVLVPGTQYKYCNRYSKHKPQQSATYYQHSSTSSLNPSLHLPLYTYRMFFLATPPPQTSYCIHYLNNMCAPNTEHAGSTILPFSFFVGGKIP